MHADLVMLLVGLAVGCVVVLRLVPAGANTRRASVVFLGVLAAQGTVGFVQYFTDLPIALVGVHLLGAALASAVGTWLVVAALRHQTAATRVPAATANTVVRR